MRYVLLVLVSLMLVTDDAHAELVLCANNGAGVYTEVCKPVSCRVADDDAAENDPDDGEGLARTERSIAYSEVTGCDDDIDGGEACTVVWTCH